MGEGALEGLTPWQFQGPQALKWNPNEFLSISNLPITEFSAEIIGHGGAGKKVASCSSSTSSNNAHLEEKVFELHLPRRGLPL